MPGAATHIWNTIAQARSDGRCLVMGIVNTTPDSFSDGGLSFDSDTAVRHARHLIAEGADIIDIGGESTRPGAQEVSVEEEIRRVIPVIERLAAETATPISIDTRKAEVARLACEAGASIVNDISALQHDPNMTRVVEDAGVPVVLMHMQGNPETMQNAPAYDDVVDEVRSFLAERINHCRTNGIEMVIADPGIGFGKRLEHNLALIRRLPEFLELGVPVLLGASRKRFIGEITGIDTAAERLGGSIAAALIGAVNGASIVRVHDVRDTVAALNVLHSVSTMGATAHAV